jgi:hypothetical protein
MNQFEGAKKISESSLLLRNSFSISGVVLNDDCKTAGDIAFHTDVRPAKWLKIGLQRRNASTELYQRTVDWAATQCVLLVW